MGVIDVKEIPKSEGNVIGAMLYTTITQFYSNPENQADFEKWLAKRKQGSERSEVEEIGYESA